MLLLRLSRDDSIAEEGDDEEAEAGVTAGETAVGSDKEVFRYINMYAFDVFTALYE